MTSIQSIAIDVKPAGHFVRKALFKAPFANEGFSPASRFLKDGVTGSRGPEQRRDDHCVNGPRRDCLTMLCERSGFFHFQSPVVRKSSTVASSVRGVTPCPPQRTIGFGPVSGSRVEATSFQFRRRATTQPLEATAGRAAPPRARRCAAFTGGPDAA